jgi:nucleoside-diphosphate-sugar epimerase
MTVIGVSRRPDPRPAGCARITAAPAGDLPDTAADARALEQSVGYMPAAPVEVGAGDFVEWYLQRHGRTDTAARP